jgi:hypothetical protein
MAVAVTLLLGAWGSGKTTVLNHWIKQRPQGERWAVLMNEAGAQTLSVDSGRSDGAFQVMEIAGGCACCSAQMVFQTQLVKLLRGGPWSRIFIELASQAHAAPLIDGLRSPSLRSVLRLSHVVQVLDGRKALESSALDPHTSAALGAASDVILNHVQEGSGDHRALEAWLHSQAMVAPRVHASFQGEVDWAALATTREIMPGVQSRPIGSGGQVMMAGPLVSGRYTVLWWFPAEIRFERRATLDALAEIAASLPPVDVQALFGSAREWQRWQLQPGFAPRIEEVAWRLDHRFEVSGSAPMAISQVDAWSQAWLACVQAQAGFSL